MRDAKTKRKRRPKPGDVQALRRVLWAAIRRVEEVIDTSGTTTTVLRAVSALSTAAGVYLKAAEVGELEERLTQIDAQLDALEAEIAARPGRQS